MVLELTRALVGPEDFRFHLLQLRRDEALAADGRLFARVALRHVCQVRLRDLDEITEDGIEPDLERFDPCLGDLALLQLSNPGFSVAGRLPQLVQVRVEAVSKNSAFLQDHGRIVEQRLTQFLCQLRHLP